jgi:ABC-type molybdate transport system substrate-binding protein
MERLNVLLLFCFVALCGCGPKSEPQLYIYCNETFWYVMQEEALLFNKIYGFQIYLIPIRAERSVDKAEGAVEIGTERSRPTQWRSMPSRHMDSEAQRLLLHPEIEQQIESIAEGYFGDLFLSDSQKHFDKVRQSALSAKDYSICYLILTMLVPKENPHQFRSIKEVLDTNRKLGIIDPSLDGLGEASWHVLDKIVPGGEFSVPKELVQFYERQYDLLEALEQGDIDAALVWNATSQVNYLLVKYGDEYNSQYEKYMRQAEREQNRAKLRAILTTMYDLLREEKTFAEEVPLLENPEERYVIAIRLVVLSSADNVGHCERFADYMRSHQGKEILRRFGFAIE